MAKDKPGGKSRANPRGIKPHKTQSNSDVLEGVLRFSFKFYDPNHAVFHDKNHNHGYPTVDPLKADHQRLLRRVPRPRERVFILSHNHGYPTVDPLRLDPEHKLYPGTA